MSPGDLKHFDSIVVAEACRRNAETFHHNFAAAGETYRLPVTMRLGFQH